jgi:hypothetical protein
MDGTHSFVLLVLFEILPEFELKIEVSIEIQTQV